MPATMMHLYAGCRLFPSRNESFLLGCILPDCVDADRALKDRLHFRDVEPAERLPHLVGFGKLLDLTRPFDLGVLFHFYLDYLWDNGPQSAHRKSYGGDNWFRDYRKELRSAGSITAQRFEENDALWHRLAEAVKDPALRESVFLLPEEDVQSFMAFNVRFHTEERLPESAVFSAAVVEEFTDRAVRAFRLFLNQFFPELRGGTVL